MNIRSCRRGAVLLLMTAALLSAGCDQGAGVPQGTLAGSGPAAGPSTHPYKIATTVGMITDIVRGVAGDKANVTGIIGEGVDPHLYRATRNDIATLMASDVIFYNGLLLEGKMADSLIRIAGQKPVFAVTDLIDASALLRPEEMAGHDDPHVWMDVSLWIKAVEVVARELGRFDPAHANDYETNAKKYVSRLERLHQYAVDAIGTIPESQRVMITAHDAFNYFGRAYNLDVLGIQGISTESEAGLEQINRLVDHIVERGVRAVFVESSVSQKNIRALIEGAADRGADVTIGGELFSDAMGAPGTYEGTYVGMIDHNVTTVVRALGGTAPSDGMDGRLQAEGHE
ncbi:MAG: manganese transporter [Phycisphaeraceae bacterium]|nr:manganese transporter [Phycisphaeraceae bacterium]